MNGQQDGVGERSLAELAGHNLAAADRLTALRARELREGTSGVRAAVADRLAADDAELAVAELADDLVEAVLTIAERNRPALSTRRAWADFDREEARAEQEREERP